MTQPPLHMRLATSDDAATVLEWRNDPVARRMSLQQDAVAVADHMRWFAAALADPDRVMLVAEASSQPVGICRFDVDADHPGQAEISVNLDPAQRGRGIGRAMVRAAIDALRSCRPEIRTIVATIRAENPASIRLFEGLGFSQVMAADGVMTYERGSVA